jgi:hypothetical protein
MAVTTNAIGVFQGWRSAKYGDRSSVSRVDSITSLSSATRT